MRLTSAFAAANSIGLDLSASGGTTTNTGINSTVSGGTLAQRAAVLTASGGTQSNTGALISVTGTAPTHSGLDITTNGGTTDNSAVRINATAGTGATENIGLNVTTTGSNGNWNIGMKVVQSGTSQRTRGVYSVSTGGWDKAYGGQFEQQNTTTNFSHGLSGVSLSNTGQSFGVSGFASGTATSNIGVWGYSSNQSNSWVPAGRTGVLGRAWDTNGPTVVYGVYGQALGLDDTNGSNGHTKWAGWMAGHFYAAGNVWTSSDENLKIGIEDYPGDLAREKLLALHPISYQFDLEQYDYLGLPAGQQIGFGAGELQQVLPELVLDTKRPADLNEEGEVVHEEMMMKVVNYQGLTPVLVAAFRQQELRLQVQEEAVNELRQTLTDALSTIEELRTSQQDQIRSMQDCCTRMEEVLGNSVATSNSGADLRVIPNPVASETQLRYTVPAEGRVKLLVSTSEGRVLETLLEMSAQAGMHSYTWNTSHLALGHYVVTLFVDGTMLAEKAVKVE